MNWTDMTPAERDDILRGCRAGDDAARSLGLTDPAWDNLENLGDTAEVTQEAIAIAYAKLVGVLPGGEDGPVQRTTVRDETGD